LWLSWFLFPSILDDEFFEFGMFSWFGWGMFWKCF
jgi:hypothetical protein